MDEQQPGSGITWVCRDCGTHENVAGAYMTIGPRHTCQANLTPRGK